MLILANYAYHRPSTSEEALALLKQGGTIIAGGSDIMPQLKTRTISPSALIDLANIQEMKQVEEKEDGLHIGAAVVLSHLSKNPLILERFPALSQAARNVASPQIRNRGTVGGNLLQARRCFYYNQTKDWRGGIPRCFKVGGDVCLQIPNSPVCRAIYYSDMAPVLLAYGAKAQVLTADGEASVDCAQIMAEHCQDRLSPVLIREFVIPRENYEGAWGCFMKYSLRGSVDFPIINFACVSGPKGTRLMAGAIATQVLELTDTQAYLQEKGKDFSVEEATEIAQKEMKAKSQIIRESGISVQVKRSTFRFIEELLAALKEHIQ